MGYLCQVVVPDRRSDAASREDCHYVCNQATGETQTYLPCTEYPGGFKQVTATQLHLKDPKAIVKLAVYGMLPRNLSRRTMMQRLHLFPEDDLPEDILLNLTEELPQPREIPRRLNEYSQEEREAFPTLWTPPEDYRMK
ncbi:large ribosomal subunit protein uL13m isoform 3-T4 [Salvelinus alpinus]|uniref:large ribosomal subunit protein uL13m isoform X3 n=1 Tax=Salvelinus alpinus TaxID=8036 RepID=UPI0039FDA672